MTAKLKMLKTETRFLNFVFADIFKIAQCLFIAQILLSCAENNSSQNRKHAQSDQEHDQGDSNSIPSADLGLNNSEDDTVSNLFSNVGIIFNETSGIACSGTLFQDNWVLTAASCLRTSNYPADFNVQSMRFYLGTSNQRGSAYHVLGNPISTQLQTDIAIIKFQGVSMPTTGNAILRLPTSRAIGDQIAAVGWGLSSQDSSQRRRFSNLTLANLDINQNILGLQSQSSTAPMIQICPGDIGGPIASKLSREILGVIRAGNPSICGTNSQLITSILFTHVPWIMQSICTTDSGSSNCSATPSPTATPIVATQVPVSYRIDTKSNTKYGCKLGANGPILNLPGQSYTEFYGDVDGTRTSSQLQDAACRTRFGQRSGVAVGMIIFDIGTIRYRACTIGGTFAVIENGLGISSDPTFSTITECPIQGSEECNLSRKVVCAIDFVTQTFSNGTVKPVCRTNHGNGEEPFSYAYLDCAINGASNNCGGPTKILNMCRAALGAGG